MIFLHILDKIKETMDNLQIIDEKSDTSSTSNDELDIENQDHDNDGFTCGL